MTTTTQLLEPNCVLSKYDITYNHTILNYKPVLSFTLFLCKNYTTNVYTLPCKVTNLNYHQVYVLNHFHLLSTRHKW